MARPHTLIPGNCYFTLGFYDADLLLPVIQTLLFERREERGEQGRLWIFREPAEPTDPDQDDATADVTYFAFTDRQLFEVLDLPELLSRLRAIAEDHPLQRVELSYQPVGPVMDVLPSITKFLSHPEYARLSISNRFTGKGFSLNRWRNGRPEMSFYVNPRREPDEERKIRAIFNSLGIAPHEDYLSDRGRRRILAFAVSAESNLIEDLCNRLLTEVFDRRAGDVVDCSLVDENGEVADSGQQQ